jgi:dynein heavy chain
VDGLKARLAQQEIEVQKKNEAADRLIHIVGVETEKVSREKAVGKQRCHCNWFK